MVDTRHVVTLEVPEAWFANPVDGVRHQTFYASILAALAEMAVLIDPVWLPRGAERAPRPAQPGDFTLSFHSHGPKTDHVLRCKESYIPPFYTMDTMGYSCFSQLASQPELFSAAIVEQDDVRATDFVQNLAQQLRDRNLSKYPQPECTHDLAADDGSVGYIFVPLQIGSDSVAEGGWIDPHDALETVITAANARGMRTVIKRHPLCRDAHVAQRLETLSAWHGVTISETSIHHLIAGASLVVGANSGVLFEALIQGKPVISHAASDFGPATQQVQSHEALARAIAEPAVPDAVTRNRFLFWYLTQYCVRADDVPAIRTRLIEALTVALAPSGHQSRTAARRPPPTYLWGLYGWSLFDRIKRRLF